MGNCENCKTLNQRAGEIIDASGEQALVAGQVPEDVTEQLRSSLSEGCRGLTFGAKERRGLPALASRMGLISAEQIVQICNNPLFSDPSFITEKSQV